MRNTTMGSLDRGLTILTCIAERGEASAATLARTLDIPLSSLYRYLAVLSAHELVVDDQGMFTTGWRAIGMSGRNLTHTILAGISGDVLDAASSAMDSTAVISVRAGSHAVCLRQVRGQGPDAVSFRISQLLPVFAGAGQRILLAYSPASLVKHVISRGLVCPTGREFTPDELRTLCAGARNRGYEVSRGELIRGAFAVGVPVLINGEVVCSLTVAGPAARCDNPQWINRAVRVLHRGVKELAEGLQIAEDGDSTAEIPTEHPPHQQRTVSQ